MLVFDLKAEEQWNPERHVERVLGKVAAGDVTDRDQFVYMAAYGA